VSQATTTSDQADTRDREGTMSWWFDIETCFNACTDD
jgi:hypothetical protein